MGALQNILYFTRPLIEKYFENDYTEGKTLDVIKMLADEPEDVRPDSTLFQRRGNIPTTSVASTTQVITDNTIIITKKQKPKAKDITNKIEMEKKKLNEAQISPKKLPVPIVEPNREDFPILKDVTFTKTTTVTTEIVRNTAKNRRTSVSRFVKYYSTV